MGEQPGTYAAELAKPTAIPAIGRRPPTSRRSRRTRKHPGGCGASRRAHVPRPRRRLGRGVYSEILNDPRGLKSNAAQQTSDSAAPARASPSVSCERWQAMSYIASTNACSTTLCSEQAMACLRFPCRLPLARSSYRSTSSWSPDGWMKRKF